jgi:hypothetical protein
MDLPMPSFNPGYAFRDGKLYTFRRERLVVIRPWGERAGAWVLPAGRGWAPTRPIVSLGWMIRCCREEARQPELVRAGGTHRVRAWSAFLDEIPLEVVHAVTRFRPDHWPLLQLANRGGDAAIDLMASNPALAWLLAARRRSIAGSRTTRGVQRLLRRRQNEIAAALGFPRQGAREVLRKVARRTIGESLLYLPAAVSREPKLWKTLLHLPRINTSVLRIVTDPALRSLVRHTALVEIGRERRDDSKPFIAYWLKEILRIAAVLNTRVRPISEVDDLMDQYGHLTTRLQARREVFQLLYGDEFPSPPLEETGAIRAVRTADELFEEGREMNHCVFHHVNTVRYGERFIYTLLAPERATVSLAPSHGGWAIEELRGPANAPVSRAAEESVRNWIRHARPEPSSRSLTLRASKEEIEAEWRLHELDAENACFWWDDEYLK